MRATAPLAIVTLAASAASAQVPAGVEFAVNTYTTGEQRYPVAALDPAGRFQVSWTGQSIANPNGSGRDVYLRRFDPTGLPLGLAEGIGGHGRHRRLRQDPAPARPLPPGQQHPPEGQPVVDRRHQPTGPRGERRG